MKKIFLSMLAIAALASCSKSENSTEPDGQGPDGRTEIRLTSGIVTTDATKAGVGSVTTATAKFGIWEAQSVDYTTTPTWTNTASVSGTETSITLNPARYYNANNDVKTYIKGWYPAEDPTLGVVTFTNKDGEDDVIVSNEVSGSKETVIATALTFVHKTTQLTFKVVGETSLATDTKLEYIQIVGAEVPEKLTLSNNVVGFATPTTNPLSVGVSNNPVIPITPTAAAAVGSARMIKPVGDNNTLKLNIKTDKATYTNVPFAASAEDQTVHGAGFAEGVAYTITLTFSQGAVTVKGQITPWNNAQGSGTVQ